ncbi:MAG: rod shape-determining protein RodA [Crocinitomicaceae bacterium]|nr:rod shape-determining protein RodA [Crocinitomicaceae bacterium]
MRNNKGLFNNLDWILILIYFLLVSIGLLTIYSVAYNEENASLFSFSEKYGKQFFFVLIALFCGFILFLIDADIYKKFAVPIYFSVIFMLLIVLFMPPINGARSWIGIGPFGVQPAEFAKIASALLLAKYLSSIDLKHQDSKKLFFALSILFLPMGLILLQPDAGTFLVFTSFLFVFYREGVSFDPFFLFFINNLLRLNYKRTWIGVHFIPIAFIFIVLALLALLSNSYSFNLFSYKINGFYLLILSLFLFCTCFGFIFYRFGNKRERKNSIIAVSIAFVLAGLVVSTVHLCFNKLASHQKNRIELFLGIKSDPDGQDYNRNRAMAAVGSGGFYGKGYKNASVSSVKTNHVPESETDFIFCPFAEEWGFLGSAFLLFLFLALIIRIIIIAERQRSSFNRIYAYCVAMILFYHLTINIGMNIGFAPIIGIPLPFFSYGGSSILSFTIMLFLLLKLDSQRMNALS